ncbi:hypothetical protein [Baekduia soli]|uniref:hypothetical protein n=1 Tax=Baekduia soli TaxID=496014 RepID=UPI0016520677|nr:hypothetical protein [Baekduia soli]
MACAFAFMAGNTVELGPQRPDPGGPVLRLRLLTLAGGTDVKRGRRLSREQRRAVRRRD